MKTGRMAGKDRQVGKQAVRKRKAEIDREGGGFVQKFDKQSQGLSVDF